MSEPKVSLTPPSTPGQQPFTVEWLLLWALRLLLLVAIGIALYLTIMSVTAQPVAGCGPDSDCSFVLNSQYASIFGIPVAGLAIGVYLATLILSYAAPLLDRQRPYGTALFSLMAGAILSAAIAYVSLQLIVLKSICPYCMIEHVIGTVCFIIITILNWRSLEKPLNMIAPLLLGMLISGLLVLAQSTQSPAPTTLIVDTGESQSTGQGKARQLEFLDGNLKVDLSDAMIIGDPDAPHVIVKMFDYACPHCRKTYFQLKDIQKQMPGQLLVVHVPTPIDAKCNAAFEGFDNPRFQYSCDLAHLALAVHAADATKLDAFETYLFTPELRPVVDQARQKAIELIGEDAVNQHFKSQANIARMNKASHALNYLRNIESVKLPVLMAPNFPSLMGSTESTEELLEILQKELFAQPTTASAEHTPASIE